MRIYHYIIAVIIGVIVGTTLGVLSMSIMPKTYSLIVSGVFGFIVPVLILFYFERKLE